MINVVAVAMLAGIVPVPALPTPMAYVRGGDVYVSAGPAEKRITTGAGYARPRWSPDGRQLAVLRDGRLWTMKPDGTGQRRVSDRPAGGASWSPDGKWLAFASTSCTGGPGVYRIAAAGSGNPEVLFPAGCRGEDLPEVEAPQKVTGSLADRLRVDDAVAWSPDGKQIAFRGGECDAVYDACLSIGTVSSGEERTVAAYGGGSLQNKGFAAVPAWSPDGKRLAFTAYQEGETAAENEPVHVVEWDPGTGAKRTVGVPQDREAAYLDAGHALVTSQTRGHSWVTLVDLKTGARTLLHQGSQPSARPR
ncbi:Vegetative incompatibility protein HET-E-1 [Actinoplanes sp. SE50]|uniref:PD40 domain-containing protein n=1 Tax=unclassified Actinoplanes TaxID=2626549 RepID=UPI00023EC193|nr:MULTISPECIES: PD40 domain-containing protein [unclassified Actinoplanes]AEV87522.1 Vegetative incompatibility protein HET-E-1 [Actinoplanes sp. SE50/110]ATO85925.1 Vegetative incompatibility protein HET-E-1 [Actinoplanes sp. SE50]SLM03339.1 Vegetative incompatibility protein HET-E-1 [Actinoplanes sp. SE50/110]